MGRIIDALDKVANAIDELETFCEPQATLILNVSERTYEEIHEEMTNHVFDPEEDRKRKYTIQIEHDPKLDK